MSEHYIAIDNVCAWPNLTQMPDGEIVATIFNQPTHGGWEGDVECWVSRDRGLTWHLRGVPAPHEPGTNRMNVAAGRGHDGALLVLASGWSRRNPVGDYSPPQEGEVLPIWACRSGDGGRTWDRTESVAPPPGRSARIMPFGDIVQLRDGTLGVCIYSWSPPEEHNVYFYTTSDGGRTWGIQGTVQEGNINETTPLVLPDGNLLTCARTLDDQHLDLFRSTDHGCTWQREQAVTGATEHPAHLLNLADGRILLTYGRRGDPFFQGIGYRLSADGGHTWSEPMILQESGHRSCMKWPHSDGGYPASVQLEDGQIVTAYYSSKAPGVHERYHMGVVRWKVDED